MKTILLLLGMLGLGVGGAVIMPEPEPFEEIPITLGAVPEQPLVVRYANNKAITVLEKLTLKTNIIEIIKNRETDRAPTIHEGRSFQKLVQEQFELCGEQTFTDVTDKNIIDQLNTFLEEGC